MFFAFDAADINDTPVIFPPGRAKLATMPVFHWVGRDGYNGNFACCLFCGQRGRHIERHDHVHFDPDQFGRELRKTVQFSFRGAKLECNILSLYISKFTQPFT
jgi:hypothetical protein